MKYEAKWGRPYMVRFKGGGWSTIVATNPAEAATLASAGMVGLPVPDGEEPCSTPPAVESVTEIVSA